MAWKFFNSSGQKKIDDPTYGFATIEAASSIAIANNTVNSVTSTGNSSYINSMTGGIRGSIVTLQASGQVNGTCLILVNGTGPNNLSLTGNPDAFGIYAGESVTFQYDGFKWVEVNRNVRTILQTVRITTATTITATTSTSANTGGTLIANLGEMYFDGVTPMSIEYHLPYIYTSLNVNGWTRLVIWQTYIGSSQQISDAFLYYQPDNGGQEYTPLKNSYRFIPQYAPLSSYRLVGYRDTSISTASAALAGANNAGGQCTGYLRIARSLPYV